MTDSKYSSFNPNSRSKYDQKKHRRTDSSSGGELMVRVGEQEWSNQPSEKKASMAAHARTASGDLNSLRDVLPLDITSKAIQA